MEVQEQQWGDEEAWGVVGVEQRAWFDTSTTPAHLVVKDVRGRDEGSYRCKVHFKASPSWSQRVTLTVTGQSISAFMLQVTFISQS